MFHQKKNQFHQKQNLEYFQNDHWFLQFNYQDLVYIQNQYLRK